MTGPGAQGSGSDSLITPQTIEISQNGLAKQPARIAGPQLMDSGGLDGAPLVKGLAEVLRRFRVRSCLRPHGGAAS
jgi:hypothetical protein